MKILVTGAAGQLGQALQALQNSVTVLPLTHSQLDITNLTHVREALSAQKPDAVINAAAYNDVDRAESEPEMAMAVNAQGPENLSVATAEKDIPFVHVSTDYVFDGKKGQPYHELDKVNPLSAYAKSKWAGEERVRICNPKHFIARTAWVFHSKGENFFTKLLALSKKGPLKVVDDQFSSPTYAPHLAQGLIELLKSECYGTYHVAGQGGTSRYGEFQFFAKKLGLSVPFSPISSKNFPQKAPRPVDTVLTTVQVPRILLPPWEQGIEEFVKEIQL